MILSFSVMSDTFAQSEKDFADVGPVGVVNESADIKVQEIEEKYQNLKNKHHAINEEFNSTNSTTKITELKSDYIQTVKELNTLSYVEPERDYLAEWTVFDAQIIILEDLQYDNYTESRQVMIDELYVQMNEIEQKSITSMILDPADKTRLYNLEMELHNKYSNPDHATFVSNEFVEYAYVDHVQKKVFLVIDENKALAENGISSILVAQNVMDTVGIDNVIIDFAEITLLGCNGIASDCDPLVGGVSIGRADSPNDHSYADNTWQEINVDSPLDNKTKYIFYYNSKGIELQEVSYYSNTPSLLFMTNTTKVTDTQAQIKAPKNYPVDGHHSWMLYMGIDIDYEHEESDCFNIYTIDTTNSTSLSFDYVTVLATDLSDPSVFKILTLPDYCLPHTIANYPHSIKTYENIRGEQVNVYLSSVLKLLERNYLVEAID